MTINGEVDTFEFVSNTRKRRYRCKRCGTQFASFNVDKKKWSIWSSTVNKTDGKLPSSIAATAHMFYGTRQFDVNDNLGKWEARTLKVFYNWRLTVHRDMRINHKELPRFCTEAWYGVFNCGGILIHSYIIILVIQSPIL